MPVHTRIFKSEECSKVCFMAAYAQSRHKEVVIFSAFEGDESDDVLYASYVCQVEILKQERLPRSVEVLPYLQERLFSVDVMVVLHSDLVSQEDLEIIIGQVSKRSEAEIWFVHGDTALSPVEKYVRQRV